MDLTQLYKLHERGELDGDDLRWNDVSKGINKLVEGVVRRRSKQLYGAPIEAAITDVVGSILGKFISKRFSPLRADMIEPVLLTAAGNDLFSLFRRSRSPTPVAYDGAEGNWIAPEDITAERMDTFGQIRNNLNTFRFPEHTHVREAILAFFLAQEEYPEPGFLSSFGVGVTHRRPVYNAAIVDLNNAMMSVVCADAE